MSGASQFVRNRLLAALAMALALPCATGLTGATATSSHIASARSAQRTAAEFYAPRSLGPMECGVYLDGVHCQSERPGHPYFAQVAELKADGGVTLCSTHSLRALSCNLGNAGERTPTLRYGRSITVGAFRCTMLRAGVKCTVLSSGRGFILAPRHMTAVGGAVAHPAPLHLGSFLSPDRKVWCGLGEGRAFCGTGLVGLHQTYPAALAQLDAGGKVSLCFYAHESEAPLFHGSHEGCLQNWDEKAPILHYGQSSELDGVKCTSALDGITCEALTGSGFRVSSSEAVQLSS